MTAYSCARGFGRGRLFSAWLQVRFWLTGGTGEYRIRPRSATLADEALLQDALDALELSIAMGSDETANLELTKDAIRTRLAGVNACATPDIPTQHLSPEKFSSSEDFEQALYRQIKSDPADGVCDGCHSNG